MAGLNYWQKKARAIKFGKAEDRPQDEMKKFMLYRRRINFMEILPECSFDVKNIIKAWVPLDHEMPENFVRTISMDNKDNFIFVQDDQQFDDMLMKLRTAKVLALDFEYHDDHSYLGMITLIQLSTYEWDFFIDPFTLFTRVRSNLKDMLEDPSVIKVLHGCANDVRFLQRDFGIFIVGVIDTQMLFNVLKANPSGTMIKFDNMAKCFYKPNDLAYLSENEKAILTFADFRQRPLPKKILLYALADVHILIRIYFLMKEKVGYNGILQAAQQTSSLLLKKGLTYTIQRSEMPILTFKKSKELQAMNPNKRKLVEEILNWRLDLALRIDEKPEYLIKDQDLLELVSLEDKSPALMTILERISQYSESIELWKASLCKILSQGLKYLENMKATSCHNYGGNGHCAWGCLEDYSEENQKRYYRDNPQSKTAVNRRRRQQKQENKRIRNEQNSREGAPNE